LGKLELKNRMRTPAAGLNTYAGTEEAEAGTLASLKNIFNNYTGMPPIPQPGNPEHSD
jgi:hypothetical protein